MHNLLLHLPSYLVFRISCTLLSSRPKCVRTEKWPLSRRPFGHPARPDTGILCGHAFNTGPKRRRLFVLYPLNLNYKEEGASASVFHSICESEAFSVIVSLVREERKRIRGWKVFGLEGRSFVGRNLISCNRVVAPKTIIIFGAYGKQPQMILTLLYDEITDGRKLHSNIYLYSHL